ncbi:MAG: ABC transporter ATP-binding protein, partial [Gammaproteobacteria bacterium]|nr:ABC transporter ATP-binding protein [Gammaproteobacteria bacterium]
LDAKLREQMQLELIKLQKEIGITFVYVTHDQGEALALSHRVAVMNRGSIAQVDEPSHLYGFPNSRFVADFIGQCNLLAGTVKQLLDDRVLVELEGLGSVKLMKPQGISIDVGSTCTLTLRPEKIHISSSLSQDEVEAHFKGVVHDTLYLGDVTVYKVELINGMLVEALLANSSPGRARFFEVGDQVEVAWHSDAGHLVMD